MGKDDLKMRSKVEWEEIEQEQAGYLYRAKVPGGWFVKQVDDVLHTHVGQGMFMVDGHEFRSTMFFYPDPDHKWGNS